MKRLKRVYEFAQFFGLILCFIQPTYAQVSSADSLFLNSVATEQVWISYWNYPGNWFIRPEVNSVSNLYSQAQLEFPFQTSEYANCYASIQPAANLVNDSLVNNSIDSLELNTAINLFNLPQPFRVLPFTLNGQTGYARALLDSSHNNGQHKVAYMVVLGSGTNLIKQFFDNQGYHNSNCATMNYLKTRGDVYVMTSPNEEQRAIYFNKKKMKSSIAPSFLLNYLNADNRAPGITRLIEYVAMIKYLKQEYDRVIVLGLSTGGKVAHWISLMAEPDAALISSGYSVLVHNDLNSQNVNAIFYGPYQTIYTKDSLKNRLKQAKTQFLFTLPQNDAPIAQLDIDSSYTKTFYQDAINASFFYGYTNHAFPPCYNMDTFFNRCILKPKIKILPSITGCTKDSTNLPLHFIGTAPFSFSLWHNGNAIATFNNVSGDTVLHVYQAGQYWIDSLHDASPNIGYRSDTFHYTPTPPLQAQWQIQNYNCLANGVPVSLSIQGAMPFNVSGIINNQSTSWQQNGNYNTLWGNGDYKQFVIQDSFGCILSMPDSFQFNFAPISINTLTPIYDCDSNKTKINFSLQGNGPWVLNYTVNGLAQQMVFTQVNTDVFFANGLYQFIDVIDNTGCMTPINQSFSFQYQALSWNITQQAFDCDSNLYKTQWAFTGNGPWTLTYELIGGFLYTQTFTSSNATLYLPNGQWQMLSVSDNTGCIQAINVPITVNYTPLSVITSIPQYDCDSNKMQVSFSVQGNAPFVFQVNQLNNNNTQWLNTLQNNPSFWWGNGQYLIQQVTDATGCIKSINQYVNHTIQPLAYQALPKQYNCDSQKVRFPFIWQGNAPWIISYRNLNNGLVYTQIDSLASSSIWLASGQYALLSLSDAYCTIPLQDTLVVNFPNLNVQLTTPGILCDSNKARMELTVQAGLAPLFLYYIYNGIPDSMPISVGQQTKLLPNGSYYFNQVRDSAQCAVVINKSYTANYIPLQWYPWTNQYNCLNNINNISFNIAGANNTTLYYTRNGNPNTLLLNAGTNNVQWNKAQYQLAYIRDTAQCSLLIDTTFTISDEPIAFEVSNLKPICEDKVHEYTFKVRGKMPWGITYNYENATRTINLTDTTNRWTCNPGKYDFVKIMDANGCELALSQIDTLPNFIPYNPILTTNYQTLQVEPNNFPTTWWFNQQAMDSILYNGIEIRHKGEGSYYASLEDEAKCIWNSNTIELKFDNPVTLYPNPASDQIALLIQDDYGTNWRWQISNVLGQNMAYGQVSQPLEIINIKTWPSGTYSVLITYQNSPNRRIVRFIKK